MTGETTAAVDQRPNSTHSPQAFGVPVTRSADLVTGTMGNDGQTGAIYGKTEKSDTRAARGRPGHPRTEMAVSELGSRGAQALQRALAAEDLDGFEQGETDRTAGDRDSDRCLGLAEL